MNPKSFLQSKTVWGAVAMLTSLALKQLHVEVDAAQIETVLGQAVDAVQVLIGVGGFVLTIYGRFKATQPVKIGG